MKNLPHSKLLVLLILVQALIVLPQTAFGYTETTSYVTTTDEIATTYTIVDTEQITCYNNMNAMTSYPTVNESFYGQDANYMGNHPHYQDNGDGTVTDLNTNLMWQQTPGAKQTYAAIVAAADNFELAGYDDWRLPTIKELYSLILFSGEDPSIESDDTSGLTPFIDTNYFTFEYGDTTAGERIIDSQYISSTTYVAEVEYENEIVFGVNFADGRIKGYGTGPMPGQEDGKLFTVIHVRGNENYGINDFVDNLDGTITDDATSLIWAKNDCGGDGMNWEEALNYVQEMNDVNYLGYNDWRLPNVKELQSIVDYTRSPNTTNSAAINHLFNCTVITNEIGEDDYAFYWSSTTHAMSDGSGGNGAYVAFGRSLGYFGNPPEWIDVHGAGSQRSDPKMGDPEDYPYGHGPQGDAIRIYNYVRLVRGGVAEVVTSPDDYPSYYTPSVNLSTLFALLGLIGVSAMLLTIRKRKTLN